MNAPTDRGGGPPLRPDGRRGALALALVLVAAPLWAQERDLAVEYTGPAGSSKPFLTAGPDGDLLLSWLEPVGDGSWALKVVTRHRGQWLEPRTVLQHDRFFVNWADFPSVVETSNGAWLAHWLEKTEAKPYAYHVMVSSSSDRGASWSPPRTAHADRSPTEHGFVAMVPGSTGSVSLAWLDGGQMTDEGGAMALRSATWLPNGTLSQETVVDARTCECCQVSMARGGNGLVVAYRDRSDDEIRDIAVARELGGRWTRPVIVHRDGFATRACPVNGPAIDASGHEVVVAWFTAANGELRVKAAFSHDGGASFDRPLRIDLGNTVGRVQTRMIGPGAALVVWLEATADGAEWMARRVTSTGSVGRPTTLGRTSRSRDAGFPRSVVEGGQLYTAWSEPGQGGRVLVTRLPVQSLDR